MNKREAVNLTLKDVNKVIDKWVKELNWDGRISDTSCDLPKVKNDNVVEYLKQRLAELKEKNENN